MAHSEFKNPSTQIVYRWLTKEEKHYDRLRVLAADVKNEVKAFAKEIEALVRDFENPLSGQNSLYSDILKTTFNEVDWLEIAETFLKEKDPFH